MTPEDLVTHYPRLYHMAEANTWESIKRHGLRSTTAVLDLLKIAKPRRFEIESVHRPELIDVSAPAFGTITIRDQKPMSDAGLRKALEGSGITPRQWYELLNRRVFFWATRDRLLTLLNAKAYRHRMHTVLTVDTERFVRAHLHEIELCPMNSGCTKPMPHRRGPKTFLPVTHFPFQARRKAGSVGRPVVEVTVPYAILDIESSTLRVEHMLADKIVDVIHSINS